MPPIDMAEVEAKAGDPGVAGCSNRALMAVNPALVAWASEEMKRGTMPIDLIGGFVAVLFNGVLTAGKIAQKTGLQPSDSHGAQFVLDMLGDELKVALGAADA